MFDSHWHPDDPAFADDLPAVFARAQQRGISHFLSAGVEPEGWVRQSNLAREHTQLSVAYGLHPWIAARNDADLTDHALTHLARALRGEAGLTSPVALGEIGLDRTRHVPKDSLPKQVAAFRAQLDLARAHNMPVVLHILRAHGRALEVMCADGLPDAGGVLHSYSGPPDMVRAYAALGLYFSFSGAVTFPKANKTHRAAAAVPSERLLIETDAPFITPEPHRPGRNEPAYLVHTCAAVASLRGTSPEAIAALTTRNAHTLFNLAGD